jgi:hypothetical protein
MKGILMLAVLCAATPLYAATLTVTNLNDTGAGSLRDAVATAVAGDEIVFDASLAGGTITFAAAISPTVALTITGLRDTDGKPAIALDGNDASPFFFASANLTLNNLRLSNGRAGDSLIQTFSSRLVLSNCVMESNVAGSGGATIDVNAGSVELTDCTFLDNNGPTTNAASGGLAARDADVSVRRCTFSGNTGEISGAIMFLGQVQGLRSMVIEDSTFTANASTTSFSSSGAISVIGAGGSATVRVLHAAVSRCTFSENTNGTGSGGHAASLYSASAENTIQFVLRDSIVEDSLAGSILFQGMTSGTGGFTSFGHNVCTDAPGWMNAAGDQVNTDPLLAPLADNGGLTPTHAIDTSSPAYNAGNPAAPGFDQRLRLRDATPDIGAFELQRADIGVAEGATAVASGGTLLSTTVATPGTAQSRAITISNAATADLDLAVTVPVTITDEVNCTASATMQPSVPLAPGFSSDLVVEATPTAAGFFQYTVTIASSDPNTPNFSFTVVGYAMTPGGGGSGGSGQSGESGDDDSGCSTGGRTSSGWTALAAMALLLVTGRVRSQARTRS